jgi:hypothetical protein
VGFRETLAMLDLEFRVEGARPEPAAAAPTLRFDVSLAAQARMTNEPLHIHSVALRCQIRIEPARRRYSPAEQAKLLDLFGTPERWGQTLRPFLWTEVGAVVRSFEGATRFDLAVPCSYDFALAATKYFDALEEGDLPVCFLFSGSLFYEGPGERLQVAPIPWDREAYFRLPAATWRSLMDLYYPNMAWLGVRKDVFDRLLHFRSARGLTSWEQTIETLLEVQQLEEAAR